MSIAGDAKAMASRAAGSFVAGAVLGGAAYGSTDTATLPGTDMSVPLPVAFGVAAAASSVATDVFLNVAGTTSVLQDKTTKMAAGAAVAGATTYWLMNEKVQSGSALELGVVGALSVYGGEYIAQKVYATPGPLL